MNDSANATDPETVRWEAALPGRPSCGDIDLTEKSDCGIGFENTIATRSSRSRP